MPTASSLRENEDSFAFGDGCHSGKVRRLKKKHHPGRATRRVCGMFSVPYNAWAGLSQPNIDQPYDMNDKHIPHSNTTYCSTVWAARQFGQRASNELSTHQSHSLTPRANLKKIYLL
ncbi:hypothetical protein O181_002062 [Austropuccinia psidii MF-1]|uniref:Uncharacterized protein n=1 Tax=Austropuccinia psidii MF-1 TaxID=1389203 RepID=A0A9Q3BC25_9BASI|nr:hypothetical protein [Austropuccinia psidii MF-1]